MVLHFAKPIPSAAGLEELLFADRQPTARGAGPDFFPPAPGPILKSWSSPLTRIRSVVGKERGARRSSRILPSSASFQMSRFQSGGRTSESEGRGRERHAKAAFLFPNPSTPNFPDGPAYLRPPRPADGGVSCSPPRTHFSWTCTVNVCWRVRPVALPP